MGERELEVDAVGVHLAVAVGELPEQHPEPDVKPRLWAIAIGPRAASRATAPGRPARSRAAARRPRATPSAGPGPRPASGRPPPRPGDLERRGVAVVLPGAQQVARAEQLGGVAAGDLDAAQQQTVEDEQAVAGVDALGAPGRPARARRGTGTTLALVACRACARWSAGTSSARPGSRSRTLTRSLTCR